MQNRIKIVLSLFGFLLGIAPLSAASLDSIPILIEAYSTSTDQKEQASILKEMGELYARQYQSANSFQVANMETFPQFLPWVLLLLGLMAFGYFQEQSKRRRWAAKYHEGMQVYQDMEEAYHFQLHHNTQLKAEKEITQTECEQLKNTNRELQGFAYMATHDLKEPLRTIGSYAGLIKRRYQSQLDEDANQFLGFITDGVNRMHNMLSGVLNYSGVDTNVDKNNWEWVNTTDLVKELKQSLEQQIKDKNATIIIEDLPPIRGDRNHLAQIFQNLISNGLKYNTQEKPIVLVDFREKDGQYIFGVHDNGIGLDMDFKEKIFEVFQRLHGKETYEGTGIGLAICKKLIQQYEGEIWVESEIGQGSRFFFSFPAVKPVLVEEVVLK